jgi:hypothetical protein
VIRFLGVQIFWVFESPGRFCGAAGQLVVPGFVVTFAVDRNLFGQLKSADALIGIGEDYPIAGPEISILAKPVRGHQETLRAGTEFCFPAVGGRSLWPFTLKAHVVGEDHFDIKPLDFEFKVVA